MKLDGGDIKRLRDFSGIPANQIRIRQKKSKKIIGRLQKNAYRTRRSRYYRENQEIDEGSEVRESKRNQQNNLSHFSINFPLKIGSKRMKLIMIIMKITQETIDRENDRQTIRNWSSVPGEYTILQPGPTTKISPHDWRRSATNILWVLRRGIGCDNFPLS